MLSSKTVIPAFNLSLVGNLTDKSLKAVGHGVSQVRLPAQIWSVSVKHEAIQLQFLLKKKDKHSYQCATTDTSVIASWKKKK